MRSNGGAEIYIERMEVRNKIYGTVLYAVVSKGVQSNKLLTGMLRDLSDSGACLYVQERYGRGETLRLTASSCGLSRNTEVMWSQKVDDGLYKTGVRFISGR